MRKHSALLGAVALALGALVRGLAIGQDLWLDEVWSLQVAATLSSFVNAFTISFDNNHPLTTISMYVLGAEHGPAAYRLPSLIAGLLSIALAWWIGEVEMRRGWLAALLFALSYPLVVYSVEARGYALALLFALAVYACFERAPQPSTRATLGIWLLVIAGLCSHFAFVQLYVAFALWSGWRFFRAQPTAAGALGQLLKLHAVPMVFLAVLYALLLKNLRSGGGPDWTAAGTVSEALSWGLGVPMRVGVWPLALLGGAVLVWDTLELRRRKLDVWVFVPLVTVLVPLLMILARPPRLLVARYFLFSVMFFLLSLSRMLGSLWQRNRWLGATVLVLVLSGNLLQIIPFIRYGRGHYADAVHYLASHTRTAEVAIGSDNDRRNLRLLKYYARYLRPEQTLAYVKHADHEPVGPTWLIMHSFDQPPTPLAAFSVRSGDQYRLRASFLYYGPAGFHWFLYEKLPAQ